MKQRLADRWWLFRGVSSGVEKGLLHLNVALITIPSFGTLIIFELHLLLFTVSVKKQAYKKNLSSLHWSGLVGCSVNNVRCTNQCYNYSLPLLSFVIQLILLKKEASLYMCMQRARMEISTVDNLCSWKPFVLNKPIWLQNNFSPRALI